MTDQPAADLAETLLARWSTILPAATDAGRDLLVRYAEPVRHYHDLRHLAEVLDGIDLLAPAARDVDAVRLAAWFHNAVYDPHRGDNEEASATLATEVLGTSGVDEHRVAEVARLVRLTTRHNPVGDDPDGAVLCDADLAVLAADPERYGEYAADVRAEYAHIDDATFRAGRSAVLEALLGHARLFHTAEGHGRWEDRARHNVRAELLLLRGGPG